MKQGQSAVTEEKERGLQAAFTINLRIFKGKRFHKRFRYWHFDLNCGCGTNEDFGCIGSPVAFVRAARFDVGVDRFFAGFCDVDEISIAKLSKHEEIEGDPRIFMFHGDNASMVEAIPDIISAKEKPEHAIGTVLSDPNNSDVPLEQMSKLSRICPKMDFIVNWNSIFIKRARGHYWGKRYVSLEDAVKKLNKKHWIIRKPLGPSQFTLLIGRNIKVGDHRKMNFFNLDSDTGTRHFNKCNFTNDENPDLPKQILMPITANI